MYFHEVISQLAMTPVSNMWVAFASLFENDISESEIHPIVALQSKVIGTYKSALERIKAPHHSELMKNGWTFEQTDTTIDPVILANGRLISVSDLPSGPGIAYKVFMGTQPTYNDVADILTALREKRDKAPKIVGTLKIGPLYPETKPNLKPSFLELLERYQSAENDVDEARAIFALMNARPTDSFNAFCEDCANGGITPKDIIFALSLQGLGLAADSLFKDGRICMANAYALAKLPVNEQYAWVEKCTHRPPGEVVPFIYARAKEIEQVRLDAKNRFTNARKSR